MTFVYFKSVMLLVYYNYYYYCTRWFAVCL